MASAPRTFADWEPSQRYPDPAIKIVDPSFARYRLALARVERLGTGFLPTNVYRVDGKTGNITVAAGDVNRPNGLCFSPDESKLYIIEGGTTPRIIHAYDVVDGGTRLANKRKLIDAGPGTPDGMRCDVDGNIWCGWGMGQEGLDGVWIFNPEGKHIGRIDLPARCANLCFGGPQRNRLFMVASTSVYSLYVNTQGAVGG